MSEESVFAFGRKGMGAALSEKGEEIVERKRAGQDKVLLKLQSQGLDLSVLSHRHPYGETADTHSDDVRTSAALPCDGGTEASSTEALRAHYEMKIERLEGELEHLRHVVKTQENKLLLLREALERRQEKALEAEQSEQD